MYYLVAQVENREKTRTFFAATENCISLMPLAGC